MNRGQIRQAVIDALRESATPVAWTVDELNEYIDDIYSEIAVHTKAVTDDRTLTCPAGEQIIALPDDSVAVGGLIDDSTNRLIDHVDWIYVNDRDTTFARRTSSRPHFAAGWGLNHILIYPAYDSNSTITATLAVDPAPLANDSAIPRIPSEYHIGIVRGVHHRCLLKDADGMRMQRAMEQLKKYTEIVGDIVDWSDKRLERLKLGLGMRKLRNPERIVF